MSHISSRGIRLALWTGAIFCGLVLLGLVLFAITVPASVVTVPAPATSLPETFPDTAGLYANVSLPTRLVIPRLGVDAWVQSVGIVAGTGAMAVPNNFGDVGWYNRGPAPGEEGSAVIAGHRSGRFIPHGVFFDLHTLVIGDELQVQTASGTTETFVVTRVAEYPHDADTAEIFLSDDGLAHLNLITCSGVWDAAIELFSKRVVVYSTAVDVAAPSATQ